MGKEAEYLKHQTESKLIKNQWNDFTDGREDHRSYYPIVHKDKSYVLYLRCLVFWEFRIFAVDCLPDCFPFFPDGWSGDLLELWGHEFLDKDISQAKAEAMGLFFDEMGRYSK